MHHGEREKGGGCESDLQFGRYYVHSFLFPAGRYAFHSHSTNFLSSGDRIAVVVVSVHVKAVALGEQYTATTCPTVAWNTPLRAFSCTSKRDSMDDIVIILRHLNNQI